MTITSSSATSSIFKIGFCGCGCGQPTNVATETKNNIKKGEHYRFVHGHNPSFKNRPEKRLEAFYKHIEMIPECGCWIWMGATYSRGYGQIRIDGKCRKAHRVSWELHGGIIPDGLELRHTCDTPLCVNPYHLILGTHRENMQDMVARKRQAFGERSANAKLNDEVVREIKSSSLNGRELSALYDVRAQTIQGIKSGKRWKHVKEEQCPT